jgi:hypothetical protein
MGTRKRVARVRKEQRWTRKGVARVEEVGTEVGKKRGCKG